MQTARHEHLEQAVGGLPAAPDGFLDHHLALMGEGVDHQQLAVLWLGLGDLGWQVRQVEAHVVFLRGKPRGEPACGASQNIVRLGRSVVGKT